MLRRLGLWLKRFVLVVIVAAATLGLLASGLKGGLQESERSADDRQKPTADGRKRDRSKGNQGRVVGLAGRAVEQSDEAAVERAVERLDRRLEAVWQAEGIEVAPPADWMTVCRRLSLALVGTGVPLEEIRLLESFPAGERVDRYLERLLRDSRHHSYWGERLTRALVGAEDGPFITFRRRRFRLWLSEQIASNQRWDALARQLITARGLPTDQPEVNFLTVTLNSAENEQPNPIRLAAKLSRVMLGLRIDCLQCHDDFLGNVSLGEAANLRRGTQQDFHALAAFFSPARFNGLQGIRDIDHPYRYQFLGSEATVDVEPTVPWGAAWLPETGPVRQRLATWLTHPKNRPFAVATASRVWALMFGRAAGDAVDDLPLDRPAPPALDALADELVSSGYDLRHLIRVVAKSKAFRLASQAGFEITSRHEELASVFPLVRLRPEQVAGSVIQASRVKPIDPESALLVQFQKFIGINDFLARYGDVGEDEFDHQSATITQRLLMLNGELVREQGRQEGLLNATSHVNLFSTSDRLAIENLYLCVLNRRPDADESEAFLRRLNDVDGGGDGVRGTDSDRPQRLRLMEDLFWVLVNSSEFAWNH